MQHNDIVYSGDRVGAIYGRGSYFALNASYSHHYTEEANDGLRCMFVARVLVGDFTQGNPSLKVPPPKDASDPYGRTYDSTVDNMTAPSIFVTYDMGQSYPAYLIKYRCWSKFCSNIVKFCRYVGCSISVEGKTLSGFKPLFRSVNTAQLLDLSFLIVLMLSYCRISRCS